MQRRSARTQPLQGSARERGVYARRSMSTPRPAVAEALEGRLLLAVTGTIPILMIVVEGGPGEEHALNPDHDVAHFRGLLNGSGGQGAPTQVARINFSDVPPPGMRGHFGGDSIFPRSAGDNFALRATATINVQSWQAGLWTFGINSDDGARLKLDGATIISDNATHPAQDHFATVYLSAGPHTLELVYFEYLVDSTLELFAAPGAYASFGPQFTLVGEGGALGTLSNGFTIVQRQSTVPIDSLADADALLAQPFHNLVDFIKENSNGKLTLAPAILGEQLDDTGGDHVYDGVVGPYTFPTYETNAPSKRRLAMQLADADFNFSVYDTNKNKRLEPSELLIVMAGSDVNGNEHWWDLRAYEDFNPGSFYRVTQTDAASGRDFFVVRGTLKSNGQTADYQNRYYAHPNGPYDYWTEAQARAHVTGLPNDKFHRYVSGGNCRWLDQTITVDGITVEGTSDPNGTWAYWVAGVGDWTEWITYAHELSHLLDYYQVVDLYNLPASSGTYQYATMDATLFESGSYHHDPYTKQRLGWVTPTVISTAGWYTLSDVETTGQVFRVQRNATEYFLIENRWWGTSYDAPTTANDGIPGMAGSYDGTLITAPGLPDQGLAIWHVLETQFPAGVFLDKEDIGNDANRNDDLLGPGESFMAVGATNSAWADGTVSDIVISGVTQLGKSVTFRLDFTGVPRDSYEPNDSLEFASNLGTGDKTINNLTVHRGNTDWFKWIAPATGSVTVDLSFTHSLGDVDAVLYEQDQAHPIAYGTSSTDNEHMVAAVVAGRNYYLKVYGYGNSVNPDYDLAIDGPAIPGDRFEPNDSLGWAWNLGVGPKLEEHLSIHATNNADCYAWTATTNGEVHVALAFNHSLGDVDMEMYWDDQVGQGYQFLQSSTSAQDHEDIWQLVEAGENYLIRVYGYNGATNPDYALSITGTPTTIAADSYEPNGSREFASRLGTGDHTLTNLTIHTAGDSDYYRWTAPAAGVLNVDALFQHAIGDLDLEVYDTDQPGATPAAASRSADDNEHVALAVDQGHTYFIRVFGFNGALHHSYSLVIDGPDVPADRFEPNDSWTSAFNFGVGNRVEQGMTIHSAGGADWYRWVGAEGGLLDVALFFTHADGDLDLALYRYSGGSLTWVAGSSGVVDNEHIQDIAVLAGEVYYLRVYGYGSARHFDYDLSISGPAIPPDRFEFNDLFWPPWFVGADLGSGDRVEAGLSIHASLGLDWYRWVAPDEGMLTARISFLNRDGNLDMALLDAAGTLLSVSASDADEEVVTAAVAAGQAYQIVVAGRSWGTGSAMSAGYTLSIDGPDALQAPYGGSAVVLPALIQAENFDRGGQGVAYHDTSLANLGLAHRNTAVDIETTTDSGGGFDVGWIDDGEWLEYSVNVPTAGTYDVQLRVASAVGGGVARLLFGAETLADKTGPISIPCTGGWQSWQTTTTSVALDAGPQVMRLAVDQGAFNVNWFRIQSRLQVPATNGPDGAYLRREGANLRIWHNATGGGEPAVDIDMNLVSSVDFHALGGGDVLVVDFGGGDAVPWLGINFDGGAGADRLKIIGTSAADVLTAAATQFRFGASTITYGDLQEIEVDAGGGNDTLSIDNANVIFSSTQRLGSLSIGSGGAATLLAGGNKVLVTESLAISGTGRLNLTDNDLIVGTASLPAVRALIQSGYSGGTWNGPGIMSDTPGADRALGYAAGNDPTIAHLGGQLAGQPFGPGSVIVKYTYFADGNLDGQVDVVDLGILATHWQGEGRTWTSADFNYSPDGKVDVVDLGILATNWQKGVGNPLGLPLDLSAFGLASSAESGESGESAEPVPSTPHVRITVDRKTGVLTPGIGAVDFGTVLVSSQKPGPRRTLRVTNTGDGVLWLRLRKLPKGFTLVEPLDLHLMPGESDTFTVAMLRKAVARHSRTVIHLDTDDPDQARFDIPLTGVVRPIGWHRVGIAFARTRVTLL